MALEPTINTFKMAQKWHCIIQGDYGKTWPLPSEQFATRLQGAQADTEFSDMIEYSLQNITYRPKYHPSYIAQQ